MKRRALLWSAAVVVAAGLAVPGVILYAGDPGVATYQLNSLLLLPLVALVLYGLHRLLPLRVQWIAAWFVAPLGGIAYVMWPNDQLWAYGVLTVLPLIALAAMREEQLEDKRGAEQASGWAGWSDGPWGPP